MKQMILSLLILLVAFVANAQEITGPSAVCVGAKIKLNGTTPGGSWASANTATATIDKSGNLTGIATGTVLITYTVNGANSLTAVNVYPIGSPISGNEKLCMGAKTTMTSSTPGGQWISGSNNIATVSPATGEVTGVAKGNVSISYSFGGTCITTKKIAVDSCSRAERRQAR